MRKRFILFMFGLLVNLPLVSLHAEDAILKVVGGGGWPGSTGNVVPVYLSNERSILSCRFDILLNTDVLTVRSVTPGTRGEVYWNVFDGGIYIAWGGYAGLGLAAEIVLDVAVDAPFGEYGLTIDNLHIEPGGISFVSEDGVFSVSHAVLTAECRGGVPGGLERRMPVELKSDQNVVECEFNLGFDTDVLTVADVLGADYAQWEFSWSPMANGMRLVKTAGSEFLGAGTGHICEVVLAVVEGAEYEDYDVAFDKIVLTDTLGNSISATGVDGVFSVAHGLFFIVNGGGFPGSSGNKVEVHLENDVSIYTFILDLSFDMDRLSLINATRTERSQCCAGLNWYTIDERIRLAAWDCCGPVAGNVAKTAQDIWVGTGSVGDLLFEISGDAPLGEYSLNISNAILLDPLGNSISVTSESGAFTVVRQGDVNGDGNVNVADIVLVINIILITYQPTLAELSVADCNDDGIVNILDTVCIVNIIFGD